MNRNRLSVRSYDILNSDYIIFHDWHIGAWYLSFVGVREPYRKNYCEKGFDTPEAAYEYFLQHEKELKD